MNRSAVVAAHKRLEQAREEMAKIEAFLSMVEKMNADTINWEHVGDLVYVADGLVDINKWLSYQD